MKQKTILIIMLWCISIGNVQAQEEGPLMMGVELGYTVGGAIIGVAGGFVTWLTDPGGPTPIQVTLRDGAVLGTFVGAFFGFYLLNNAVILPGQTPNFQSIDDVLGHKNYTDPAQFAFSKQSQIPRDKPSFSLSLINFNF